MKTDLIILDCNHTTNAADLAAFEAEKERLAALIASIRARIVATDFVHHVHKPENLPTDSIVKLIEERSQQIVKEEGK